MKSSSHSGIPSLQFPGTSSLQFPGAPSLLRVLAGSEGIDRSCGGDVEEEVLVELMVVLELPKKRSSRLCRRSASRFGSVVARDHWATHKCHRVHSKACQRPIRQEEFSNENMKIMHLRFFIRLDLSIGRHHCYGGSGSPELKSFLLNVCTEAPESITNCRSSGFVEEGAGITQASAGE